jgi:HlyD family secretion protein
MNNLTEDKDEVMLGSSPTTASVGDLEKERTAPSQRLSVPVFDQPVILKQSSRWSRGIVWSLISVATLTVIWSAFARIERAVPAAGKLEPNGRVQEVKAPVGGVAAEVLVSEGQPVKKGDLLIRLDPRLTQSQQQSSQQIRDSLVKENQLYRAVMVNVAKPNAQKLNLSSELVSQLQVGSSTAFSSEQQIRLQVGLAEVNSRIATTRSEIPQLQQQLAQLRGQLATTRRSLQIDQGILGNVRYLAKVGAVARVQMQRQEQEALKGETEVNRLTQEIERIQYAIAQAEEKVVNTIADASNEMLSRINENDKRIAEIDNTLHQAKVNLQYQELRAPVDGTVFDLKMNKPDTVISSSEPILKIVPNDQLVAEVYITNQDIGFIRKDMDVDIRIDSFPFSEFGDVKGTLVLIGSDALPPDAIHPFYRFPAKVRLNSQSIKINGQEVSLQPGMSVTANIITTHNRSVLAIFLDQFANKTDSLKNVR